MPLSTLVFYCGNLLLLTAYLLLAILSAKPGGVTGVQQQGPLLKWSGVTFFALAACLHLDMAIHTILHIPFFDDGGTRVTWDFSIIVFAKMASVVVALYAVGMETRKRNGRRRRR